MPQHAQVTDTSHAAYAVQQALVRRTSPMERLRKAFALSRQLKLMAMDAIRRRHPEFDETAVRLRFIELTYGKAVADDVRRCQKERTVG